MVVTTLPTENVYYTVAGILLNVNNLRKLSPLKSRGTLCVIG